MKKVWKTRKQSSERGKDRKRSTHLCVANEWKNRNEIENEADRQKRERE